MDEVEGVVDAEDAALAGRLGERGDVFGGGPGLAAVLAAGAGAAVFALPAAHVHVEAAVGEFGGRAFVGGVPGDVLGVVPGLAVIIAH